MKKNLKTIIASILAGSTVVLSACGIGGGSGGSGGNNKSHIDTPWWTTTGTLNKVGDEIAFSNINLNLVTVVAGADLTPFKDIVAKFNQANEGKINVKVESVNEETYASQVANRIQVGMNVPDLLMTHSKLQKALASKEHIQPLDEIIEATGYEIDWNNYSTTLAKDANLGYDNAMFTVPVDMQSQIVLYNKQILNALGKSVPTTREEVLDVCEAYKQSYSGMAVLMPTQGGHFHQYVYPTAFVQNGGELYDEATNKVDWTSAKNVQAFKDANESILSLKDAGYMTYGLQEKDVLPSFYENEGLFLFIPPWQVGSNGGVFASYAEANGIDASAPDYMNRICERIGSMSISGLFAMDETKATANNVYVDSHSFSISVAVEDINKKAACLYFIKWFTEGFNGAGNEENIESAIAWAQAGHNSCNAKILNNPEYINNAFVKNISQNYYNANSITTIGCNPFAGDLVKHLKGLSPKLLASPNSIESEIKKTQDEYNGQIEFDEEY